MFRLRFSLSLVVIFCFAYACAKVSDDSITTDIKAKMFSEPLLKSSAVNVTSKDGIVTITGIVPDDAARLAAEHIASQTKGVKQLIDSTTMAAPPAQAAENVAPPAPAPRVPARRERKKEKAAVAQAAPAPAPAPTPAPDSNPGPIAPPAPATPVADAAPAPPPPAPPPQPITVTVPEGTVVTVRTIDPIDSKTSSTGQWFHASLEAPVVVGDQVVLPKGLNAKLKLVQASSAGKIKGTSELTVSLASITYQGKTYVFDTSDVQEKGGSRGKRSAEVIGGGAVLGALIGGLAGGGKGAAIGAGVGAGAGTGVQLATHGQQVKIPSETRLDFTMHAPVDVTFLPNKKAAHNPAPTDSTSPPSNQQ